MEGSSPPDSPDAALDEPLPLSLLLERARAPGAGQGEVDALLSGLSLPLAPGEDAHARAGLLHDLLEDKRVSALRGSNGQRVAHAAGEALVALGEPYSLAVSPERLVKARTVRSRPVLPTPGRQRRSRGSLEAKGGWLVLLGLGGVLGSSGLYLLWHVLSGLISSRFNSTIVILYAVPMLMGWLLTGLGGILSWVSLRQMRREKPRD